MKGEEENVFSLRHITAASLKEDSLWDMNILSKHICVDFPEISCFYIISYQRLH